MSAIEYPPPYQAKLFAANTKAEMLKAEVEQKERERTEQSLRSAAAAMAGKACVLVDSFIERDKKVAERVARLRGDAKVRLLWLWLL